MLFASGKIKWRKRGLIIRPNPLLYWAKTHCMIPTPYMMEKGLLKLFFSGRDENNRSNIGYAILDMNDNCKVLDYSQNPILTPGDLGCFDDNGVTPSCVKLINEKLYLYYIGWNPGSTVRMHLFGGLAISDDNGENFERWSRAPIIERCKSDPYLNTAPWVIESADEYRMYYVSGYEWKHKDLPRYNIKIARSQDGKNWERNGFVCIDFSNENENALARPYVIYENGIWKMWFAYKGLTYRLGYAESLDGLDWERRDNYTGIDIGQDGFDNEMIEYAAIVTHKNQKFMFYNGNNYGFDGIGLAVEE